MWLGRLYVYLLSPPDSPVLRLEYRVVTIQIRKIVRSSSSKRKSSSKDNCRGTIWTSWTPVMVFCSIM